MFVRLSLPLSARPLHGRLGVVVQPFADILSELRTRVVLPTLLGLVVISLLLPL